MVGVGPTWRVNRGSCTAGVRPVKVSSADSSCSGASTSTRSTRSGCTTSIRIGPTAVLARSAGARPEVCTDRCTPSCSTLNAASMTLRLG
jgi:hypothetical protein